MEHEVINDGEEQEVVIMMTDMVGYSHRSVSMAPLEISTFLIEYQTVIQKILSEDTELPGEMEPSAGDGCVVIFRKLPGEDISNVCNRAIVTAMKMSKSIEDGILLPTRIGLLAGNIVEVQVGESTNKFGVSFSVANRLEELCGYFGCNFLIDRDIAKKQTVYKDNIVSIGKVSVSSMLHPVNLYTIYKKGVHNWPDNISSESLQKFIELKNSAMRYFGGNRNIGRKPYFPHVREKLLQAQRYYTDATGKTDRATDQVLQYISENPEPDDDFNIFGMRMMEKKRDVYGERISRMSAGILKAFNEPIYHALIEEVSWEYHFKLEWHDKDAVIIEIGSPADGVYYLESGYLDILDGQGNFIRQMGPGTVFGEVAYSVETKKRTATVLANTDVVIRKISIDKLRQFPELRDIFRDIAKVRMNMQGKNGNN